MSASALPAISVQTQCLPLNAGRFSIRHARVEAAHATIESFQRLRDQCCWRVGVAQQEPAELDTWVRHQHVAQLNAATIAPTMTMPPLRSSRTKGVRAVNQYVLTCDADVDDGTVTRPHCRRSRW